VVHAFRTGRPYWWFWIIMSFPVVGVLGYVVVELRPTLRRMNWQALLWRLKNADERIRIRRLNLEESSTQSNRLLLADELRAAGRDEEAAAVLQEGLRGPFANDAELLLRLASIHLHAQRPAEAEQVLARMQEERNRDLQLRKKLLEARLYGQQGKQAEATALFEELMKPNRSEGPRYYYAEFLLRNGEPDKGVRLLWDILAQYRRGTPVWRFQEREWYAAARRLLRQHATGKVS